MNEKVFHLDIKAFPDIPDSDIAAFADHILELSEHPTPQLQDAVDRYFRTRVEEGIPIVPEESKQIEKAYEFQPFSFHLIPNLEKFPFLEELMKGIQWPLGTALVFKNGSKLYPHTDRGRRSHVVNFPILNAYTSKTNFYALEDENEAIRPSWCYTEGVRKVSTLQYKEKNSFSSLRPANSRSGIV